MSDKLLADVEHNITAEDEFENTFGDVTINLNRVLDIERSEVTLPDNAKLDLKNQVYILEYNVSDFRGESILVERELQVHVTPPKINLPIFESEYASNNSDFSDVQEPQELEFSDPLNEWEAWINSIYSIDHLENNITSEIEVSYAGSTVKMGVDEIFYPQVVGDHTYSFKIIDQRLNLPELRYLADRETSMTTTASQTITLIKTIPKFSYQDNSAEKEFEIQGILLNQLLHGISAIDLDGNTENEFMDKGGAISLIQVSNSEGITLADFNSSTLFDLKTKIILSNIRYLTIGE